MTDKAIDAAAIAIMTQIAILEGGTGVIHADRDAMDRMRGVAQAAITAWKQAMLVDEKLVERVKKWIHPELNNHANALRVIHAILEEGEAVNEASD